MLYFGHFLMPLFRVASHVVLPSKVTEDQREPFSCEFSEMIPSKPQSFSLSWQ